jgi:exonuclease SbcC
VKILRLSLMNLNSLAGEWSIDFTGPDFEESGLFAVTGPTGVGKTTILDGICLALYGATPRLGRLSKNSNEIMTRGRGECSAELTFETPAGRWRSHWSQHRARRKAEGELQAPRHELAEAVSGRVLETLPSRTLDLVAEITGMNFTQFTRSMMLAQGAFAVFLNAEPADRADLLEQITGAEIYSEISRRVHERQRRESQKLAELRQAAPGLRRLAEADEKALRAERSAISETLGRLEKELTLKNAALAWRRKIAELERSRQALAAGLAELRERQGRFAAAAGRLKLARQVQGLARPHERLATWRRQGREAETALGRRRAELPALEEGRRRAIEELEGAEKARRQARLELEAARPALREVRELDLRLKENLEQQKPLKARLEEISSELARVRPGAAPERPGDFQAWSRILSLFRRKHEARARDLGELQAERQKVLDGREESAWRDELLLGSRKLDALNHLREGLESLARNQKWLEENEARDQAARAALKELGAGINLEAEKLAGLEREAGHLKARWELQLRLRRFDDWRRDLLPGQPCALCGATEHPYADPERRPGPEVSEESLRQNESARQALAKNVGELKVRAAAWRQSLSEAETGRRKLGQDLERLNWQIRPRLEALGLAGPEDGEDPARRLSLELTATEDRLLSLNKLLEDLKSLDRKIRELNEAVAGGQKKIDEAQGFLREALALRAALESLDDRRASWLKGRQELLGDLGVEAEEKRLEQAAAAADQNFEAKRSGLQEADRALENSKAALLEAGKSLGGIKAELAAAEKAFSEALRGLGLADEAAYLAAALTEAERAALEKEEKALSEEEAVISARQEENAQDLERELAERLSEQSASELGGQLESLTAESQKVLARQGAVAQRLADHDQALEQERELNAKIEAQLRECRRWDGLHHLIGSADGGKYRHFAQGLTFEIMVGQANRQLARLSDRYLLVRDPRRLLELNVIDQYQAGESRSTRNLSGGESFLVSLALALGLSQMASRRVRVDSLFLDEGFGTLDEDALDLALDTLAGLRGEGKLIGVISHIPALMNRIGTQIRVRSKGGPHSRISGPGVLEGPLSQ